MKIAVKDLKPNPFKPNVPLDENKVLEHMESLKCTGFGSGVIQARKTEDGYERAFGDHRLEAARRIGIKEIEITILPSGQDTDDIMLKMMAGENAAEWGQRAPVWTMEVVKTTFNRLKEQGNLLPLEGEQGKGVSEIIAKFLAWPSKRVEHAYANLRSTGEIKPISSKDSIEITPIKKEIFAALPTQQHASEFRRAVKATRASPKVQKTYVSRGGRVETSIPS